MIPNLQVILVGIVRSQLLVVISFGRVFLRQSDNFAGIVMFVVVATSGEKKKGTTTATAGARQI